MKSSRARHLSRVTSKYQATIPGPVRVLLGIHAGDRVAFEVENGCVTFMRALPEDVAYASALTGTLSEWESPQDEDDYRDLKAAGLPAPR